MDARLVVLSIENPYTKNPGNEAEKVARAFLATRGNSPRLYQNTLVFLAVDKTRLQDLDEAVRRYLAWESIISDKDSLDLSPHQVKQAETQLAAADSVVDARLPESYQWLLVPNQKDPQSPVEWNALRLSGVESLAVRASKKLRNDESLVLALAGSLLRMHLDRVPLWRGDHVAIRQLCDDFARYLYLPRLKDSQVLVDAIRQGIALLTWQQDSFALAESRDDSGGRYRGLQYGTQLGFLDSNSSLLVVRSEVAKRQIETETAKGQELSGQGEAGEEAKGTSGGQSTGPGEAPQPKEKAKPKRYHGSIELDPSRVGRDASRIADEVIVHLTSLPCAQVKVVLEIQAQLPGGAPEQIVRTVTENGRTLKFRDQGFEEQ